MDVSLSTDGWPQSEQWVSEWKSLDWPWLIETESWIEIISSFLLILLHTALRIETSGQAIFYCTDVEGDLEWFLKILRSSDEILTLQRVPPSSPSRPGCRGLRLDFSEPYAETGHFVYGGDACDKSPGDMGFVALLLDLKDRYPDRVHFILGNRDTNKLRLFSELHPDPEDTEHLPDPSIVSTRCYWDTKAWNPDLEAKQPEQPLPGWAYPRFLESHSLQHSWISILKWTFVCTMGSPDLFEHRRTELASLRNLRKEEISDITVYHSFRNSVTPGHPVQKGSFLDLEMGPWMLEFLNAGRLSLILGDYLFVHGAITPASLGVVPGKQDRIEKLPDWMEALDSWFREQMRCYTTAPEQSQRYGLLIDYNAPPIPPANRHSGVPDFHHAGTSIVNADWFVDGDSAPVAETVSTYIATCPQVCWVVCGHKPHGDSPAVVRHSREDGFQGFLDCDSSYSDPGRSYRSSFSRVHLYEGWMDVSGVLGSLGDDRVHGFQLAWSPSAPDSARESPSQEVVGRQLPDSGPVPEAWRSAWVKTTILRGDGKWDCVVVKAHGYNVQQSHWPLKVVQRWLSANSGRE